jgi:hypothetical protein
MTLSMQCARECASESMHWIQKMSPPYFQSRENRQCHVSVSGVTEPPEAPCQIFKCVCVGGRGVENQNKFPRLAPTLHRQ